MARIMTDETSLTRRRRELQSEVRVLGRIHQWEIGLGLALLVAGVAYYAARGSVGLAALGLVIAFFGFGHRLKAKQDRSEADALEAGAQGEAQAARQLAEALDQTHYLFNDILLRQGLRTAQIDHLVVCPRGIFVIETKNWRGRIEGRGGDPWWTQIKHEGDAPIRLKSPAVQVQRQAAVVAQLLRSSRAVAPAIVPVVAFASPKTELRVDSPDVPVVHVRDLPRVIAQRGAVEPLPESAVDEWVNLVSRRL